MANKAVDPGLPSEVLQSRMKAEMEQAGVDWPPKKEAPEPKHSPGPPPPPKQVAPELSKAPEPKIDVQKFEETGKVPLNALPNSELEELAKKSGVKTGPKVKREDVLAELKKKGVDEVKVDDN